MIKYTSFNLITLIAGLLINCNIQAADLPGSPDNLANNNPQIPANPTIKTIPSNNFPNNKLPSHVTTIPNSPNAQNAPNLNNIQNSPPNLTTNPNADVPTITDNNNNSNTSITINAENEPNTYQDNNITPTDTMATELEKLHNPNSIPNSNTLPNTNPTNTTTKSIRR